MDNPLNKRFADLLTEARNAEASGDLVTETDRYLKALRIITPDDAQIEIAMAAQALGAIPVVEHRSLDIADSQIRSKLVSCYRSQGNAVQAHHHAEIALYLDRALHGDQHNDTSASWYDLALTYLGLGKIDEALAAFLKSDEIDRILITRNAAFANQHAWRMVGRGAILADYGYIEEAARFAAANMNHFPELFEDAEQCIEAYNRGCQCLQNVGEHILARRYLETAIQLARSRKTPQRLRDILLSNIAVVLEEMDDFDTGEAYLNQLSPASTFHGRTLAERRNAVNGWRERYTALMLESQGNIHDIFISYNTVHQNLVEDLCHELQRRSIKPWTFREIAHWDQTRPNEQVIREMQNEISRSAMILAVGSSTSFTSQFVIQEIECAVNSGVPIFFWYPEGIRLTPKPTSTWSTTSKEMLRAITLKLSSLGVFSYYGYGLRERRIEIIVDALMKRMNRIYPNHKASASQAALGRVQSALEATRLWPVLLDSNGSLLVPELVHG